VLPVVLQQVPQRLELLQEVPFNLLLSPFTIALSWSLEQKTLDESFITFDESVTLDESVKIRVCRKKFSTELA
jgi:hypothetical protein